MNVENNERKNCPIKQFTIEHDGESTYTITKYNNGNVIDKINVEIDKVDGYISCLEDFGYERAFADISEYYEEVEKTKNQLLFAKKMHELACEAWVEVKKRQLVKPF